MAPPKLDIDWDAVEISYRAGMKTLRVIAQEFGITEGAIRKRAVKEKWVRDLQTKIREQAQASIAVSAAKSVGKAKNEREVVEVNAEIQKDIILDHRLSIGRGRTLTMTMLEELEAITINKSFVLDLIQLMDRPDEEDAQSKATEILTKIMSLPGRATTLKTIVESLKSLIAMEREAFGVDDKRTGGSTSVDDVIKLIAKRGKS